MWVFCTDACFYSQFYDLGSAVNFFCFTGYKVDYDLAFSQGRPFLLNKTWTSIIQYIRQWVVMLFFPDGFESISLRSDCWQSVKLDWFSAANCNQQQCHNPIFSPTTLSLVLSSLCSRLKMISFIHKISVNTCIWVGDICTLCMPSC